MGWIYIITNTKNGKCYIGQTIRRTPEIRWSCEKSNPHGLLRPAFAKYGVENFKFETICEIDESEGWRERLDEREILEIQQRNSLQPNGYNIERGGRRYKGDGNIGKPRTEETKLRISSSLTGKNTQITGRERIANRTSVKSIQGLVYLERIIPLPRRSFK